MVLCGSYRCYMTLTTALHLHRGGSPKGPAGTGKTETVKDLGKALGSYVIVVNCSEGLDYKSMGRMFSGLAQVKTQSFSNCSNSAGCLRFDFSCVCRLEPGAALTSSIASTLRCCLWWLSRFCPFCQRWLLVPRDSSLRDVRSSWNGHVASSLPWIQVQLCSSVNPYLTFTRTHILRLSVHFKGYAGRTELPDNLKSMFRPISMVVPDSTLIAEIILFGEGFNNTKACMEPWIFNIPWVKSCWLTLTSALSSFWPRRCSPSTHWLSSNCPSKTIMTLAWELWFQCCVMLGERSEPIPTCQTRRWVMSIYNVMHSRNSTTLTSFHVYWMDSHQPIYSFNNFQCCVLQLLLLSMKDMNIAKLTSVDLPLFNGIMSDLFPGIETPVIDYSKVGSAL